MAAKFRALLTRMLLTYTALVLAAEPESDKQGFRKRVADEMTSFMDRTANPCEDIHQYACGNFGSVHSIPPSLPFYRQYDDMVDNVDIAVRQLLEKLEEPATNPMSLKAKLLYDSCLNREVIDSRGSQPILKLLEELGGWPLLDAGETQTNLAIEQFVALTNPLYTGNIISANVIADLEVPTQHIVAISLDKVKPMTKADLQQGFNSSTARAYFYQITETLKLLGVSNDRATDHAKELIIFEMKLLEIQPETTGVSYKDLYTKMTLKEVQDRYPSFKWKEFLLKTINQTLEDDKVVAVITIDYFHNLFPILAETDPKLLANWIVMKIVLEYSSYLDQRFLNVRDATQELLSGVSQPDPTWKRCVDVVKVHLKDILGKMYVDKYFSPINREVVRQVTEDIRREMRLLIQEKDWLQEQTKKLALKKLDAIEFFVGYDNKALSEKEIGEEYKNYNIESEMFFENMVNINKHVLEKEFAKFGQPVENKPIYSPLVINAGYNKFNNKVELPAAFLQPPNYHEYYPRALIYGAIGAFVGHEIGHAFDRNGRQFDKSGTLSNWWDEASIASFNEKSDCFVNHYNQYSLYGYKINGTISLGETMSDNSGLRVAFFAYEKWWSENKDTALGRDEDLPGLELTNYELFFLKYAQGWCEIIRPEAAHAFVQDAHPPGATRLRGTFAINSIFAKQFGCIATANCLVW